jgi:tetratricopeptide (TPR) repeat protein
LKLSEIMRLFPSLLQVSLVGTLLLAPLDGLAKRPASKEELNRIINESAGFLKNREPEMTAGEYALYEKVVAMLAVQPEFAMQLLQGMMSGKERLSPAFEFVLGNAQYNAGHRDLAEAHYRRAVDQFPDYLRAWANLGVLYYGDERYDQAVTSFRRAVELGDSSSDTLGMLAYALQRAGNSVAAEMLYLRALSAAPDNPDWIDGLCGLYIESKQYPRAEPLARQLIKLQPHEPRYWQHYAGLLIAQDRRMEAVVVLESARAMQLASDDMLLQLGDLYAQQKFTAEALAVYRVALKSVPDAGAKRLIDMAQMLTDEGRPGPAAELLASVEKTLPADARVPFLQARAELAVGRKDWPAARRDLEEAVALRPLHGPLLLRLGQVLKLSDSTIAAEQTLAAAARRPESAYQAHLELADLALRDRRFRPCIDHLEQALQLEHSPAIQQYLTKIKALASSHENTIQD